MKINLIKTNDIEDSYKVVYDEKIFLVIYDIEDNFYFIDNNYSADASINDTKEIIREVKKYRESI